MGHLLMRSDDQITAWSRCPVANNAGFNVHCWIHTHVSESEAERLLQKINLSPFSLTTM